MAFDYGRVLIGTDDAVKSSLAKFELQPVDQELMQEGPAYEPRQTTIGKTGWVTGPGTFFRRSQRTLIFEPSTEPGWWFKRDDLKNQMPIQVTVNNVWTTLRNIVLCSGSPHNYMRMVEHIIALRVGMGLDNLILHLASGDPPLFDRSSMDLVETIEQAGIVPLPQTARYVTVKEPVSAATPNGGFITFLPAEKGSTRLVVDCAIDFKTAIGKQRIKFVVNRDTFRQGAFARTNTSATMMFYYRTIGFLFADLRNSGYNLKNILVAGRRRYLNEPRLIVNGKSLEAAWHRAVMDLLAAVALIDRGRFCGTIVSYKAGHDIDVKLVRELYKQNLLV